MTDRSEYYDELGAHADPAVQAGWRNRLEQALRFEVALESVALAPGASLLDVGCGPGALVQYMGDTARPPLEYLGIDRHAPSIARAQATHPQADFVAGDVFDARFSTERWDVVVAIGTLVSGEEAGDDAQRRRRVEAMVRRLYELAAHAAVFVVLDQDALERRPALALEPALAGARRAELEAIAEHLGARWHLRDDFLRTDLALVLHRDAAETPAETPAPPPPGRFAAHERVLAGPWGRAASPLERAWLWLEAGAWQRARAILDDPALPPGEELELLRTRLRERY